MRLPNFVIIGAPKSGTTSLFYYLKQHPQIYLPVRKELHYFSYNHLVANLSGPGDEVAIDALCASRDEYASHYREAGSALAVGDVSPSYLYYAEVCEKIRAELGSAKIIAILRNPVEKAYSQYMHLVRENRESLGFIEALAEEERRRNERWSDIWRYAESSLYAGRLQRYYDCFGPQQVRVFFFEELISAPQAVMTELYRFLGVDDRFVADTSTAYNRTGKPRSRAVADFFARPNPLKSLVKSLVPESLRIALRLRILDLNTAGKEQMPAEAASQLKRYFRDDVEALARLVGRRPPWSF